MIEDMTVGAFIEDILAGGLYENHCRFCDYWHKKGCSNGYADCYHLQEEFVERILKDRKTKRAKDVPVPFECIGCPYARSIKPCIGWCMRRVVEGGASRGGGAIACV